MAIKCANCKNYHDTIQDVRNCSMGGSPSVAQAPDYPQAPATEPQVRYLTSLMVQEHAALKQGEPADLGKRDISVLIDNLKSRRLARVHSAKPPQLHPDFVDVKSAQRQLEGLNSVPQINAGYYATKSITGNNDLDFWKVTIGKPEGKWAGFRFVKRVIGGRADTPVRGKTRRQALEAIESTGELKAARRYALEIGRCSNIKCHRHLTDRASRYSGYGPVCARNLGVPYRQPPDSWHPEIQDEPENQPTEPDAGWPPQQSDEM